MLWGPDDHVNGGEIENTDHSGDGNYKVKFCMVNHLQSPQQQIESVSGMSVS